MARTEIAFIPCESSSSASSTMPRPVRQLNVRGHVSISGQSLSISAPGATASALSASWYAFLTCSRGSWSN
ncbi:MAG: hypothetical protein IJJ84_14035 [Kiritimatiellae bacterium]|nr:hypothetical protein [Kiritimatiellia bacterium]